IASTAVCPVCQLDIESGAHAFWDCGVTRIINSSNVCILVLLTTWALWHAQNKFYHEGVRQMSNEIVIFILSYMQELEALGVCCSVDLAGSDISWDPPCSYCKE
ncbi:hypothetical protein Goklo_007301, partial [Gossypium klotzschianum]|nr:hypothetical protein [Gossypium klotzschianum]